MSEPVPCYFLDGFVVAKNWIVLAAKSDSLNYDDYFFSRLFGYKDGNWVHNDLDWQVSSACYSNVGSDFGDREYCFVGLHSGMACLNSPQRDIKSMEVLPLRADGEKLYALSHIRQIGRTLFICGDNSVVLKRTTAGWVYDNQGIPGLAAPNELASDIASIRSSTPQTDEEYLKYSESLFGSMQKFFGQSYHLQSIDGFSEDCLYVVGSRGFISHKKDNADWQTIPVGTNSRLNWVECIEQDLIYVCGNEGKLLRGNADAGFQIIPTDIDDDFLCLNWFMGKLYIAGGNGLYVYDGESVQWLDIGIGEFEAHRLDSRDGQLWSFGAKKLSYFDGKTWNHLQHPDND